MQIPAGAQSAANAPAQRENAKFNFAPQFDAQQQQTPEIIGPVTKSAYDRYQQEVHDGNRYTTGIRKAETPAYVEVPAIKRVPARRVTESRLIYKPLYEETRSRLEFANDLRGDVYVTADPREGRLLEGDEAKAAPAGGLGIQATQPLPNAHGWTAYGQDAKRNEITDDRTFTTGIRTSVAPAFLEIPATKRVAARRVVESRLIYKPIVQEVRSHLEQPERLDAQRGELTFHHERARLVGDAGTPQLPEPREEEYLPGGRLALVKGVRPIVVSENAETRWKSAAGGQSGELPQQQQQGEEGQWHAASSAKTSLSPVSDEWTKDAGRDGETSGAHFGNEQHANAQHGDEQHADRFSNENAANDLAVNEQHGNDLNSTAQLGASDASKGQFEQLAGNEKKEGAMHFGAEASNGDHEALDNHGEGVKLLLVDDEFKKAKAAKA